MIIKMEQQISNDDIEGFKVLVHEWLSIDDKIKQFHAWIRDKSYLFGPYPMIFSFMVWM